MTRIKTTTAEAPQVPLRLLLMSSFGGGKTYLMGYIARRLFELTGKRFMVFDFDIGWKTLKSNSFDVDLCSYFVDDDNGAQAFNEFDEDFHEYLADPGDHGGFGLDSLTTLQSCAMAYVKAENRNAGGKTFGRQVGKFQLTNENDFGVLVTMLMQILPQILKISSHSLFVMTAHTRMMEDKNSGEMKILPAISGRALPSQIGAWFTEVWYLKAEGYREDVQRVAQTMSGGQVDCKTQMSGMMYDSPVIPAVEKMLIDYGINKVPSAETLDLIKTGGLKMDSIY